MRPDPTLATWEEGMRKGHGEKVTLPTVRVGFILRWEKKQLEPDPAPIEGQRWKSNECREAYVQPSSSRDGRPSRGHSLVTLAWCTGVLSIATEAGGIAVDVGSPGQTDTPDFGPCGLRRNVRGAVTSGAKVRPARA